MKLAIPNCPECGESARGTVDTISACAEFGEINGGETEYIGDTDVWWDEQKTNLNDAGDSEVICKNGHEWFTKIEQ